VRRGRDGQSVHLLVEALKITGHSQQLLTTVIHQVHPIPKILAAR
jgi:hypothetical protein